LGREAKRRRGSSNRINASKLTLKIMALKYSKSKN
jgi:hypothetical protein